jgi:hypothetical protein
MSYLPGQFIGVQKNAKCEKHPNKPATHCLVTEADSMGYETRNMCQKCYNYYQRTKKQTEPVLSTCDWCKATGVELKPIRDHEEGMSGPIYHVCDNCRNHGSDLVSEESTVTDVTEGRWEDSMPCTLGMPANEPSMVEEIEAANKDLKAFVAEICNSHKERLPELYTTTLEARMPVDPVSLKVMSCVPESLHPTGNLNYAVKPRIVDGPVPKMLNFINENIDKRLEAKKSIVDELIRQEKESKFLFKMKFEHLPPNPLERVKELTGLLIRQAALNVRRDYKDSDGDFPIACIKAMIDVGFTLPEIMNEGNYYDVFVSEFNKLQ